MIRHLLPAALVVAAFGLLSPAASAQSQDYFIPGQGQGRPPAAAPAQAPRAARPARPAAPVAAPALVAPEGQMAADEPMGPPQQLQLPPAPDLPALQRGASPPAAVMGVIGVPDIMRVSTAFQQVDKTVGERREKLNEDAQKEQNTWRDMEQALANDRGKLSPEQIRGREHELQERITKAQKEFRERGNILQAAAQYGQAQIERTLVGIIQRVAESRGMNIVMHRQMVALNVPEFDITEQVAGELNKALSSVVLPPDGVMPPLVQAAAAAKPATAPAKPAAAPAATPAPAKK